VLRGLLLTGVTSAFLRSGSGPDSAAFNALWWPPTKVAGLHLAAYVADEHEDLTDRPAAPDLLRAARSRDEMRALALEMAEADARCGEFRSAARWLQTIEWLDGVLPDDLADRRMQWLERAAGTTE
jgi:sulfide:quinone oxidoreductase